MLSIVYAQQRVGAAIVFGPQYPAAINRGVRGRRQRGAAARDTSRDLPIEQVRKHWEAIEEQQARETKRKPAATPPAPTVAPIPVDAPPVLTAAPGAALGVAMPTARPTPTAAPLAPMPTAEDLQAERSAKRQRAERALLAKILTELL